MFKRCLSLVAVLHYGSFETYFWNKRGQKENPCWLCLYLCLAVSPFCFLYFGLFLFPVSTDSLGRQRLRGHKKRMVGRRERQCSRIFVGAWSGGAYVTRLSDNIGHPWGWLGVLSQRRIRPVRLLKSYGSIPLSWLLPFGGRLQVDRSAESFISPFSLECWTSSGTALHSCFVDLLLGNVPGKKWRILAVLDLQTITLLFSLVFWRLGCVLCCLF